VSIGFLRLPNIHQNNSIMKSIHTFSILFWINRAKEKDGKTPIYARVTVDGKRAEISLKRTIDPDNWNPEKGQARGSKEESRTLNAYIEQVRNQLFDSYQEMQKQKKLITAEAIKGKYIGLEEREHTLISVFEHHNNEMHKSLEPGTTKNYITTMLYLKLFLKEKMNTSDIYLSQLNYKWLLDFESYVKERHPFEHRRPCGQNTAMKHIERLRKIIGLAIKNEWIDRDPFMKFTPVYERFTRQFLTSEELATIENKKIKVERLQYVKDIFIFCCYTGLAYIDVLNLNPNNISIGIDGEYWLITSRQKTDTPVKVPLLSKPLAIIEKYKNHPWCENENRLLPVSTNSRLNAYLKEIADLCGIQKNLTFHVARHTFATTVTLTNGVPIESVSSMLGHTNIKTTQIYAKVIQRKVSEDMKVLRDKLENKRLKIKKAK
jgi:site-specific recombinase XerD